MRLSGVRGFFSKPRAFTEAKVARLHFPERQKPMSSTQQSIPDGKAYPAEPSSPSRQAAPPTHEKIALRAYEIFVEQGGRPGDDVSDWLLAEQELSRM
jgi:Protein of unknown function (DUF2934)